MKRYLLLFYTACMLIVLMLPGCHTSHEAVAHKSPRQPKFIDDIYMDRHNKKNMTVSVANDEKIPERFNPEKPITKEEAKTVSRKYGEVMNVKPKEITNYSLYEFIDAWYGVNYHLGGSDHGGIDCSAFAQKLYQEVYGIDLARTAAEQFTNSKHIRHSSDANEGDLVFFHVHSRHITHVGVYLLNDYFVHASSSQGVVISNLNDDYWHKYYAGIGRVLKGK